MNCGGNEERLLMLAHGRLSPLEEIVVIPHLLVCPRCRKTLAGFQATSLLLWRASALPGESGRRNTIVGGFGLSPGLRAWILALVVGGIVGGTLLGWRLVHVSAMPPTCATDVKACTTVPLGDHCR